MRAAVVQLYTLMSVVWTISIAHLIFAYLEAIEINFD
jgi:hypothetical protein